MAETTLPKLRVSSDEAAKKIERQIEKGQWLRDQQISSDDELNHAIMDSDNWSIYNMELLRKLFDISAPADQHTNFDYSRLDDEEIYDRRMFDMHVPDLEDEVKEYQECMARSISSLKGIRHRLLELYSERSEMPQSTFDDEVFIVHGHDDEAKEMVARFVENLGIEATILHEQANRGQTIPEKFEEHAGEAGFAIILLGSVDISS